MYMYTCNCPCPCACYIVTYALSSLLAISLINCIQVSLDPSGLYAAASSADKSVVLFDIFSGECVTKLYGHSGTAHLILLLLLEGRLHI